MLLILETTTLIYIYIYTHTNMHLYYKKSIKKRVIGNNLLHGALLLERMFQCSKKFMQLSLKPKNPSLRKNTKKGVRNLRV